MNISFKNWFEATQPYIKKKVDPALLTFKEWYDLVNPKNKDHPDEAYSFTIKEKQSEYQDKKNYPKLLNNIKIHNIDFEIRMKIIDKSKLNYVKTNEQGEVLKDEKGNIVYYSKEEVEKIIPDKYQIGVFTKDGTFVGGAQDEWGAMLYYIANEYKGFGLGKIIAKIAYGLQPEKSSGGFSPSGLRTFRKIHSEFVRDYLSSGMYSHLIKTNQISKEKVNKIINSISDRPKKIKQEDLSSNDPKNWLILIEDSMAIIYDKKIKNQINNIYDENPRKSYFARKMIKGYILTRKTHEYERIVQFGGENKQIKTFLMDFAGYQAKLSNSILVVETEDKQYISNNLKIIEGPNNKAGHMSYLVKPIKNLNYFKNMNFEEKMFRKEFDKYNEFKTSIIELAHNKFGV